MELKGAIWLKICVEVLPKSQTVFYELMLVLRLIFSYHIFHVLSDIVNYIEIRALRWPGKLNESIAFEKTACLSSFVAWSIVLLEDKRMVFIAIDFLDAFRKIFL